MTVEIPKRSLFRAAEVCEIAQVQPYVLRSWEAEFPDLGVSRSAGGPRLYRRPDVERVLQIKQLLFGEGLTLAGARRRLHKEETPAALPASGTGSLEDLLGRDVRERLAEIRQGLRGVLQLLSNQAAGAERDTEAFRLRQPSVGRSRSGNGAARRKAEKPAKGARRRARAGRRH